MSEKIAIAMSGGVDSSVVARMLQEQGHDVCGITMRLFDDSEQLDGMHAVNEAARVAALLGIEHHVVDLRQEFQREVVQPFIASYLDGQTPIPCVLCNRAIKIELIYRFAESLGFDKIATGHYVQTEELPDGEVLLKKGADPKKDQSYFLFALTQTQIRNTIFPLGGMTKTRVRELAAEYDLPVASKSDSQEICFIPRDDYAAFLGENAEIPAAGDIITEDGSKLGTHKGIHRYTVGQRKGLGIAAAHPLYVNKIDAEKNQVVVGQRDSLRCGGLLARDVNWISGVVPSGTVSAEVRIRNQAVPALAEIVPTADGGAEVRFESPQFGVAPGQAAVFYLGDRLIGGGWISSSFA